jgi:hypothetical protein
LYIAESVLDGLVNRRLFLLLHRLFTRRSLRELRAIGFLCFFHDGGRRARRAPGRSDSSLPARGCSCLRSGFSAESTSLTLTVTGAGTVAPGRLPRRVGR